MWWYNILEDNLGIISHILRLYPITVGSILLTANLVFLKRENNTPVFSVKISEWRIFIDYFGISIEAEPYKVSKKNVHVVCIGYIPSTSSRNTDIARQYLDK